MARALQLFPLALIVLVLPARFLFADAKGDYQRDWSAREQKATTAGERAKFASDLIDKANELATGRKASDSLGKSQQAIEGLRGSRRDEVLVLCEKAYEFGVRQRDSYAAAARALGILQILEPQKRLDSLVKLQKMYDDVYQSSSSKNVGIAKGLAEVLLAVGEEQRHALRQGAIQGKSGIADEVAAIKSINASLSRGLDVIRAAENTIRPYASGNKAYTDFLSQAGDVEKEILESQRKMADLSARSAELDRDLKLQQSMQRRLAADPHDTGAADKLVRLYINELDDPKLLEAVLPKASASVQAAVGLLKKPVSQLSAAEASTAAQWCSHANDNPGSPNFIAMDIRTRVYCDAFSKKAKSEDAAVVRQIAARIADDLGKAQVSDAQIKELTQSYIAALEPPAPPAAKPVEVAVAPKAEPKVSEPMPREESKSEPRTVDPAPSAPERQVARIKVAPAPAAKEEEDTKRGSGSTIFDFGRD